MESISLNELHHRFHAQGVSSRDHMAMVCPRCGTVQSIVSWMRAGAVYEVAERYTGFSCVGRLTKAGPWPADNDQTPNAVRRRLVPGCDWTLGGLLQIHELEVTSDAGLRMPAFVVATPEAARALEAFHHAEAEKAAQQEIMKAVADGLDQQWVALPLPLRGALDDARAQLGIAAGADTVGGGA